jgi:6-phospho-beta-glucosidase
MNTSLLDDLQRQIADGEPEQAVQTYVRYLNRRNASYLQLEGAGRSAFATADPDWDPFAGETGYHRIAVEALRALSGRRPGRVVLDVPARGSVAELAPDDVVEIPCHVDPNGATPLPVGPLPEPIRGLVLAVKAYERATIRAAIDRSPEAAAFALFLNPIVSDWRRASALVQAFAEADPEHLGDFGRSRATDYRGA